MSQTRRSLEGTASAAGEGRDRRRGASPTEGRGATEGRGQARTLILDAAEWLFAEHGIASVSNRQIGAAAGQGNTSVVGYYFGSRDELVRAIIRRFEEEAGVIRTAMLDQVGNSTELRDWVRCLVYPYTDNLTARKPPTWYARLNAQIMADPVLRLIQREETSTPTLIQVTQGLDDSVTGPPAAVRRERALMAGQIIIQTCADHERALADGLAVRGRTWRKIGTGLVDALVGLWTAPVTR